jgi:outer membrane lipoprotein-sorting protein
LPAQSAPAAWATFEQTWASMTAYSATVAIFEREGAQVQSSVLDYTFHKPSSASVHFGQERRRHGHVERGRDGRRPPR